MNKYTNATGIALIALLSSALHAIPQQNASGIPLIQQAPVHKIKAAIGNETLTIKCGHVQYGAEGGPFSKKSLTHDAHGAKVTIVFANGEKKADLEPEKHKTIPLKDLGFITSITIQPTGGGIKHDEVGRHTINPGLIEVANALIGENKSLTLYLKIKSATEKGSQQKRDWVYEFEVYPDGYKGKLWDETIAKNKGFYRNDADGVYAYRFKMKHGEREEIKKELKKEKKS